MFVELHLIQNVPPSNLNRDDTGVPKDCQFGGHRRGRVSSQSWKRAIRLHPAMRSIPGTSPSHRTRRLLEQIVKRLTAAGWKKAEAENVTKRVLAAAGIETDKDNLSSILFFINDAVLDRMAGPIEEHFDDLNRKAAKDIPADVLAEVADAVAEETLSPDIALFGRMIAVDPKTPLGKRNLQVEASCQVAHAISTNRVSMDEDFFTAVDDLQPGEETGAGMMGVIDFNSSCYYRFSVVDTEALAGNLGGDRGLALNTLRAFLRASAESIPSGKQNSFAALTPPDFILAVVRRGQPVSLANAFVEPVNVFSQHGDGLVVGSIKKLDEHLGRITAVYGDRGQVDSAYCSVPGGEYSNFGRKADSLDALIESVVGSAFPAQE